MKWWPWKRKKTEIIVAYMVEDVPHIDDSTDRVIVEGSFATATSAAVALRDTGDWRIVEWSSCLRWNHVTLDRIRKETT